jgi:hypothetical protein
MTATEMNSRTTRTLRIAGWSAAVLLLMAPAMAMMVGAEGVNWTASDFIFAGIIFAVVGGLFELAARATANVAYRAAVFFAVACAFLQLWISLAVGIIGNEDNPANWTYFAVILIAMSASAVAAGRAKAMARAMYVTMAMQLLFSVLHLIDGHMTAVIDLFFSSLWLLSARLFARAADEGVAG